MPGPNPASKGLLLTVEPIVEGAAAIRARRIVTAGLVLAMAVVALETTVVVTALPDDRGRA